jgi:hypothetical protein
MRVTKDVCGHCGKVNAECVEFKLLWVLKYRVCQKCISTAFRLFSKDKQCGGLYNE